MLSPESTVSLTPLITMKHVKGKACGVEKISLIMNHYICQLAKGDFLIYPLNEIRSGLAAVRNSKLPWHLSVAVYMCTIKWQMAFY